MMESLAIRVYIYICLTYKRMPVAPYLPAGSVGSIAPVLRLYFVQFLNLPLTSILAVQR